MTDSETPLDELAPEPEPTPAEPVAPEPVAPDPEPEPELAPELEPEPVAVEPPVAEAFEELDDPIAAAEPSDDLFESDPSETDESDASAASRSVSVHDIAVRVGAELGRATLPLAKAVGLAPGSVIELDRAADDPIDLYVNGKRFATGQLLLVDQTDWAIRIEHVLDVHPSEYVATSPDDLI